MVSDTEDSQTLRARLETGTVKVADRDGEEYVLRPIRPSDAHSLMRGYDAMSERAKWFRMLHSVPHLSEEMAAKFCSPNPARELCLVLEGKDELEGEILGGARFAGEEDGRRAEFSVSLRPEAQGLGLARQALATVLEAANEMGYREIWGVISTQNSAMLSLAHHLGFEVKPDSEDASLMRAEKLFAT